MGGECGEAQNVAKKIRRYQTGRTGANDLSYEELVGMLGDELADMILYADLVAAKVGINLGAAVIEKFTLVSQREGFPERLP